MRAMKRVGRLMVGPLAMMLALGALGCGDDSFTQVVRGQLVVEAGGGDQGRFVQFEPVAPGFQKDALNDITIKNGDLGDLTITRIDVVGDITGYITSKTTIPQLPQVLTSEEEIRMVFRLAIPAPALDPDPMLCPEAPANLPAGIDRDRYCGQVTIVSAAPDNQTTLVYFLVSQTTGTIRVTPTVLTFDNPQVGREIRQNFSISNESTNGTLTVSKITKLDFTGGSDNLFRVDGFPFPAAILPGETLDYTVTYAPESTEAVQGKLQVESDDPANSKVTITVQTGSANAAQIDSDTESMIFPAAAPGTPETKEITLTNTGNGAALTITNFLITGNEAREVYEVQYDEGGGNFVPWSNGNVDTISRQNSKVYRVIYTPTGPSVSGTMRIFSNATNVPNGEINITLSGNEAAPDGLISPSTIVFDVAPGESDSRSFAVRNEGLAVLNVDSVMFSGTLTGDEFSISPDPTGATIAPGEISSFELNYDRLADDVGLDQGSLILMTNNPFGGGELSINVRNNNQQNAFSPVARIEQNPDGTVDTGATITLDGSGSTPESGELTFHLWTLLDRPSGSTAELSSEGGESTSLTPDVAGSYKVQLVVGNSLSLEGSITRDIVVVDP